VLFAPSDVALDCLQGALVLLPTNRAPLVSSRLFGIAIPGLALLVGVLVASAAGGASFLASLAAVATPLLAAAAGWARFWPTPWLPVLVVPVLYVIDWVEPHGIGGEAAGVALIALACLAVTALVSAVAAETWLRVGLVGLVVLDVLLVWVVPRVGPATIALQATTPPGLLGRPLPALQQAQLGRTELGWLDLAAPALLGTLVVRRNRAALATGAAAVFWSLLLLVTSPIAATPPVLAGLAVGGRDRLRDRGRDQLRRGERRPASAPRG
jgi:hypothetical protein